MRVLVHRNYSYEANNIHMHLNLKLKIFDIWTTAVIKFLKN